MCEVKKTQKLLKMYLLLLQKYPPQNQNHIGIFKIITAYL